jgi:hypothetical protein
MSDTSIELEFGDGRYRFFLPMSRIIEAERLCGEKSIVVMHEEMGGALGMDRESEELRFLGGGSPRIKDVYEIIRCAAIGGGEVERAGELVKVSPLDAKRLVDNYVDGRPLSETVPVAWAILNSTIMGVRLKKKAESVAAGTKRTRKASSSPTAASSA